MYRKLKFTAQRQFACRLFVCHYILDILPIACCIYLTELLPRIFVLENYILIEFSN